MALLLPPEGELNGFVDVVADNRCAEQGDAETKEGK